MEMDALSSSYINKTEFQRRKKKEEKTHNPNSPSGSVHLVIHLPSLMKKRLHHKLLKTQSSTRCNKDCLQLFTSWGSPFPCVTQAFDFSSHLNSAQQPLHPRPFIPTNQFSTGNQKSFPEPGIQFFTTCYSHFSRAGSCPPSTPFTPPEIGAAGPGFENTIRQNAHLLHEASVPNEFPKTLKYFRIFFFKDTLNITLAWFQKYLPCSSS